MAGWNLKSGSITEYDVSEDRIWSLFNYVFSNSSRKRNDLIGRMWSYAKLSGIKEYRG